MGYKRNIEDKLLKAMGRAPAVLLAGARQVGKTTLIKEVGESHEYTYVTLDDLLTRTSALEAPQEFIETLRKPVIIDEVQRSPELALAIKKDIDEQRYEHRPVNGRFALTGSANPTLLPKLSEALVGRMETVRMYPLSQGELQNKKETFIEQIFTKNPTLAFEYVSKNDLCEIMVRGGYPLVQKLSAADRAAWFGQYLEQILLRDVQEIASIEKASALPKLLKLLAARAGNLLVVNELAKDADIIPMTAHRYLALLMQIFLVVMQPAWSNNLSSRLKKSPKPYLLDTGLLAYLLNLNAKRLATSDHVGKVCENFVVQELYKQATWAQEEINLYHMSGYTEVDIVLENRDGQVVGIEVKAGETVLPSDAKGLSYLKEELGDRFVRGIILYSGKQVLPLAKNIHIVPVSALWNN